MRQSPTLRKRSGLVPPPGIEAIDEIVHGYQAYQVLVAGLELGLFDLLKKDGPLAGMSPPWFPADRTGHGRHAGKNAHADLLPVSVEYPSARSVRRCS